mmetsp:Transcript_2072/g.2887  ORF Transcript_2072/g.2887 Transcript_2072/m.2887 type:complete len:145 (-) Transcript_2072:250-684(-)
MVHGYEDEDEVEGAVGRGSCYAIGDGNRTAIPNPPLSLRKWDCMFQLLIDYESEHMHVSPREGEFYQGEKVGSWVKAQREMYQQRQAGSLEKFILRLSNQKIALLNEIQFVWNDPAEGAATTMKPPLPVAAVVATRAPLDSVFR